MNKIAIICPYFGKFPTNIEITFNSMYNNQFIDWYIVTDNKIENKKYNNIFFIEFTFEEIKDLIKEKLNTNIESVYKLCDYKPTYGYLFEKYFSKYEFWGYCDVDVVFGDLSMFITQEKLDRYDKIYELGHLSIYRNNEEMRKAFTSIKNDKFSYFNILNEELIYVFDEAYNLYDANQRGINGIIEDLGGKIYKNRDFIDIDIKYNNFYSNTLEKYKYYYFLYQNGKIYLKKLNNSTYSQEIAYVHLQHKKNLPILCKDFNNFIITPKGFLETENLSRDMFYKKNLRLIWHIKFRIKRKLKKIAKTNK